MQELPSEIWDSIITYVGSSKEEDLRSRGCILFFPLVNKMFNQICKTNSSIKLRTRKYPYISYIVRQFCILVNLPIVRFAHENGFAFSDEILLSAAKGRYDVFVYVLSQAPGPVSKDVLKKIFLKSGAELKCLEYIHRTLEIELTSQDAELVLSNHQFHVFDYLWDEGIRPTWTSFPAHWLINARFTMLVDHLRETKHMRPDPTSLIYYYENHGHRDVYVYTDIHGLGWPDNVTVLASRKNHFENFRYAHENGAKWHIYTCQTASENGAFECLSYAHEHGAEWDRMVCLDLAADTLKRAVEALDEPDYGFSPGYLPPLYDEAGLVKSIRYLLVHQDLVYDAQTLVLPSLEEQNRICKEYLDQLTQQKQVDFTVMYKE